MLFAAACEETPSPEDPNGPWQPPETLTAEVPSGAALELVMDDAGVALLLFRRDDELMLLERSTAGEWSLPSSLGEDINHAEISTNAAGTAFVAVASMGTIQVLRKEPAQAPQVVAVVDEPAIFAEPAVVVASDGSATIAWLGDGTVRVLRWTDASGPTEATTLDTTSVTGGRPAMSVDGDGDVTVAWDDGEGIFAARWADGVWSEPAALMPEGSALRLAIAANAAGQATLVWSNGADLFSVSYGPSSGWGSVERPEEVDFTNFSTASVVVDEAGTATLVSVGTDRSLWANRREAGAWGVPKPIEGADPDVDPEPLAAGRLAVESNGAVTAVWAQELAGPEALPHRHVFANRFEPETGWGEPVILDDGEDRPNLGPVVVASEWGVLAAWTHFIVEEQSSEIWVSSYDD